MFKRFELPTINDESLYLDGPPEVLVPGLRSAMSEDDPDGLGLRSMMDRLDIAPQRWPTERHTRTGRRAARVARASSVARKCA